MNQQEVRRYVERYLAAFSSHIQESHPAYLTVKLPVEVDKDIGNRPFYWSWVERMNLPPQPMVLTFVFDPEGVPEGLRGEHLHFGAGRLAQMFQSARKHGRFVSMYEDRPRPAEGVLSRRSASLTPWLCLNLKISFICDKKRDLLLSLGINLYQPRLVHDFYPFVRRLPLVPGIPSYHYLLERRVSVEQAAQLAEAEVRRVIDRDDGAWAEQARERLAEELAILETYYQSLSRPPAESREGQANPEEPGGAELTGTGVAQPNQAAQPADPPPASDTAPSASNAAPIASNAAPIASDAAPIASDAAPSGRPVETESISPPASPVPVSLADVQERGGRILDFLRANGIPETPRKPVAELEEWKQSTPEEEKARRIAELRWQYEPRIEVSVINGGLFHLYNQPPFPS